MTKPVLTAIADSSGAIVPGWWHFTCPGCDCDHQIFTDGYPHSGPRWQWNGDLVKPTFNPSLLVRWDYGPQRTPKVCHSFIKDGQIQFLSDCTHRLAGQTVPLPPYED